MGLADKFNELKDMFTGAVDGVKEQAGDMLGQATETPIGDQVSEAAAGAEETVQGATESATDAAQGATDAAQGLGDQAQGLGDQAQGSVENLKNEHGF